MNLVRTFPRFVAAVAVAAAGVVLPARPSVAVTRPVTLFHQAPVTSAPVEPGFPIDYVSVTFELAPGADVHHDHADGDHAGTDALAVRFRHDGIWGRWQPIPEDGAQAVGQWAGALVDGDDAGAYQVRGLPSFARGARGGALNTTDGPKVVVGSRPAGAAQAVSSCKSRADWGADESVRKGSRSYAPTQLMTVHHTATQNDDPDPDARVRAIYTTHVQNNGWDDIGYQALISEAGTVYEGRWSGRDSPSCVTGGGSGWEFGHQTTDAKSQIVTGAHTGGYNTGNFGVALLGTLTDVPPKAAARSALVEYLAELSKRHGIDPEAIVRYDNGTNQKDAYTISGHSDFTATACPGGKLYADLPAVRKDVKAALGKTVAITSPADAGTYSVKDDATPGVAIIFDATATHTVSSWSWTVNGVVAATTSSFTTTLYEGAHTIVATATMSTGETASDTIVVTVLPAVVDDVAKAEATVAGTVTGTYLDTHADGAGAEVIKEIESGGKPANRYSYLEHRWTVPVTGGSTVTLFVDAATTAAGDGDGFRFEYSLDGGKNWSLALTYSPGEATVKQENLASGTKGEVLVRVVDTVRRSGTTPLDTVTVDQLFVRSS